MRAGFVLFLTIMLAATGDPMFLILDAIVVVGLVPSIVYLYREREPPSI